MMLCSRCKKRPAVVFITAMQGEKKKNDGLCLVCAKELHVPQIDEYMKQMGITDEELPELEDDSFSIFVRVSVVWVNWSRLAVTLSAPTT